MSTSEESDRAPTQGPPTVQSFASADASDWTTEVLVDAFLRDPAYRYVLPDDDSWRLRAPWLLSRILRMVLRGSHNDTDASRRSLALWVPPEVDPVYRLLGEIRVGLMMAPLRLGVSATLRLLQLGADVKRRHRAAPPGRKWYLDHLAVATALQKQGVGSALLRRGLARVDAEGAAAYLFTHKEANVAIYRRHGFEVIAEHPICEGGPMGWTMLRAPRGVR